MGILTKQSLSETTATLEVLEAKGVNAEHWTRVRSNKDYAEQVAGGFLGRSATDMTAVSPLLILIGLAKVLAFPTGGTVKKLIRVDVSESAAVAIGYVDPVVTKWFGKLQVELSADTTLAYNRLARDSRDFPILGMLDGKEETTWGEIYSLMKAQPRGPASSGGPLITGGYANIFYVRDSEGELRAVSVYWRAGDRGWDVDAYSVASRSRWDAGDRVFSRN